VLLEPVDERARGGLAGRVAVEEQELLRIRPGQGRPQYVEVGGAGGLVDVLTALRASAVEDELADKVGVFTTSAWAMKPPREKEKMSILLNPRALMNV
jgi:hypothetical protein